MSLRIQRDWATEFITFTRSIVRMVLNFHPVASYPLWLLLASVWILAVMPAAMTCGLVWVTVSSGLKGSGEFVVDRADDLKHTLRDMRKHMSPSGFASLRAEYKA